MNILHILLLCLAYFAQHMFLRFILVVLVSCSFLFICLAVLYYTKIKVLFIHSPANEYLGCFQCSTVMNTAYHERLCSHFCLEISFLLGIPRNEIECRCMLSFFFFLIPDLFSKRLCIPTVPPAVREHSICSSRARGVVSPF